IGNRQTGSLFDNSLRQIPHVFTTDNGGVTWDEYPIGELVPDTVLTTPIDINFVNPNLGYMISIQGDIFKLAKSNSYDNLSFEPFTLLSPANGFALQLDDEVEDTLVIQWEAVNALRVWDQTNAGFFQDGFAHAGNGENGQGAYIGTEMGSSAQIVLPALNNASTLTFWASTYSNATDLLLQVEESSNGTTWNSIDSFEAVEGGTGDINLTWQQFTVQIPANATYIRFNATNVEAGAVYFDDVQVTNQSGDLIIDEDFEDWTGFMNLRYEFVLNDGTNADFDDPRIVIESDSSGRSPSLTLTPSALLELRNELNVDESDFHGIWTVRAKVGDLVSYPGFSSIHNHAISFTQPREVSIEEEIGVYAFELEQNYPNPFNPTTTIRYQLAEQSQIRVDVYTVTGQLVTTLADGVQPAGQHQLNFDASHLASGVYLYRLQTDLFTETRKMTLIK
ncbi:MAG: T9SS type A sorting domain-containing protein, partial [Balneolales bacterium]|nr:T9SS type A sorting domain-containing protein [Balneolales bacterium]